MKIVLFEGDVAKFVDGVRMPGVEPEGFDDRMSFEDAVKIAKFVKSKELLAALKEAKAKHTAERRPVKPVAAALAH
jgi:hypothetical protein